MFWVLRLKRAIQERERTEALVEMEVETMDSTRGSILIPTYFPTLDICIVGQLCGFLHVRALFRISIGVRDNM